jgi:hypothetical protein
VSNRIADPAKLVAACTKCGLQIKVSLDLTEFNSTAYADKCTLAPERPAFDFDCPNLRAAISAAHQALRRV